MVRSGLAWAFLKGAKKVKLGKVGTGWAWAFLKGAKKVKLADRRGADRIGKGEERHGHSL